MATKALRGLAIATLAIAALTAILGFAAPCGANVAGAPTSRSGAALAVMLALFAAPAIGAWRRPTSRQFVLWTGFGWVIAVPFMLVSSGAQCTLAPGARWLGPATDLGATLVVVLATCGAPVAAWLAAAASRPRAPEDTLLARRLRRLVELAFALAVVIAAIGYLPGLRLDAEAGQVHTVAAGGTTFAVYLVVLLAPGALVHVDPSARSALLWSLWALPAAVVGFALIDPDLARYPTATLWPQHVVEIGFGTLVALILIVLPVVWIATRDSGDRGELPEARLAERTGRAARPDAR